MSYSRTLWLHRDPELKDASEKVGALYYRWSAAAEEHIVGAGGAKKNTVGVAQC